MMVASKPKNGEVTKIQIAKAAPLGQGRKDELAEEGAIPLAQFAYLGPGGVTTEDPWGTGQFSGKRVSHGWKRTK
jgi:hypothetical protein